MTQLLSVLFLDLDGVVNSRGWYGCERQVKPKPYVKQLPPQDFLRYRAERSFDPLLVERVNQVCEQTACALVLSSSWRIGGSLADVEFMLRHRGLRFPLADATPHGQRASDNSPIIIGHPRGREIQAWLDAHPECSRFAIVDDNDDMEHLCDVLVQTNELVGIQDSDVARLVAILGKASP